MAFHKAHSESIVTPEATFSYVTIWQARAHKDSPENKKHSVVLVFNKTDDLSQIQTAYNQVLQDGWDGELPYNGRPGGLVDGAVRYPKPEDVWYHDKMLLSLSTSEDHMNFSNILDMNMQPFVDKSKLYSGARGRGMLHFYSYEGGTGGIGCELDGLVKTADGEPLAGTNVDAAAGFAAAGLVAQTAPPVAQTAPPVAQTAPPVTQTAHIMTPLAKGITYEAYIGAGWTDAQLIQQGMMNP